MEGEYDISNNLLDNVEQIPQKSGKRIFYLNEKSIAQMQIC